MDNKDRLSGKAEHLPIFKMQRRRNYGGKYTIPGGVLACYTKKQMKILYPGKGYEKAAEYAPGSKKESAGELHAAKAILPLTRYGIHSRLLYSEKGFVTLDKDGDRFAVLLKNALLPRIAALAACLILVAAGIVLALNPQEITAIADEALSLAGSPELEQDAVDWEGVHVSETGGVAESIAMPGYKSIMVDAGKTEANVNLYNPENNPCYFVISLVLDDGTLLYQSDMIAPGKGLYKITLAEPLPAGEYAATLQYETYSLEDLTPMNGANIRLTLIAQ